VEAVTTVQRVVTAAFLIDGLQTDRASNVMLYLYFTLGSHSTIVQQFIQMPSLTSLRHL